jgi:negative regulator of sigma E activity
VNLLAKYNVVFKHIDSEGKMGVFEMVVAVVAIGVVGGVIREAIKKQHEKVDVETLQAISNQADKIEAMEARIQTLEAIVTDSREELKRKIDALD